jgi:anti-sigma B factor antagonist
VEILDLVEGDVLTLTLKGRLDGTGALTFDGVAADRIAAQSATIIDLSEVAYVSSAGLRVLLKAAKTAKSGGRALILCGLLPQIQEVFDISGFTGLFRIVPDRSAALQAVT